MIYETQNLIVRLFEAKDAADRYEWRSDLEVSRYEYWKPESLEEVKEQLIDLANLKPSSTGWNNFAVELKETGKVIGDIALNLHKQDKQAEIGYAFNPAYQGKSLAYEAAVGILAYGKSLKVHRFYATADARNTRSIALMKRLGMQQEAHFLEICYVKNEWCDEVVYAILARNLS